MKSLTSLVVSLAVLDVASARGDDPRARILAPFLDNDVIAVGRLDLVKLDVDALARRLIADQGDAGQAAAALSPWIAALRQAGAKEMFVLVVLPELLSPSTMPFSVIVPAADGADTRTIGQLLCGDSAVKGPTKWPTCAVIHNAVFAGTKEALERARQTQPVARSQLSAALTAVGDTQAELVFMPSADSLRVVEELLPTLPQELGNEPITTVTRGLKWAAAGLSGNPEPRLQALFQASDGPSAQALNRLGKRLLQYLRDSGSQASAVPDFARVAAEVKAEIRDDRISVQIDASKLNAWAAALFGPVREKSARSHCVKNLMQIGIALHNYHDTNKSFPPAYTTGKAGKPLLSWRVLILPYLDQDALFKEFHLDEPWDSPHNRTLIDRMPDVYRCPAAGFKQADRGKTTYLAPRGKATAIPGPEGVKIQKFTDGTSNTIFVADGPRDRGVIWTRPDDWDVDGGADLNQIFGEHPSGTNFLFVDGSVRFIKNSVDLKVLSSLLTRYGGEVISHDQF